MDTSIPRIPRYFGATIPAGESRRIEGSLFKKWYIVSATGVLNIKTNFSAEQQYTQRSGEEAEEGVLYERLEIFNRTANPIDVVIFYGYGNFIDKRNEDQGSVEVTSSALPAGAATAAKQDTLIAKDFATQTTLAAVLAKIIAAPATEATLVAASAKLPAALDADGRLKIGANALGAQANAWNAAATGANGTSAAVDTKDRASVSAFGNADGATTITVQVSQDNVTYYDTASTVVLGAAGDFHVSLSTGAKYVRLKSSNNRTVTATITAK